MRAAICWMLFLLAIPIPLNAQFVYFSPNGSCSIDGTGCLDGFSEFYVFIRAEAVLNTTGSYFYIEGDEFSQFGSNNVLSVEPHEGVVIESGDLFSGMTLSWPAGQYASDTLLTIHLDPLNMPLFSMLVFTRGIELCTASEDTLFLDDFIFYCSHCTGLGDDFIEWQHPDTIDALIGAQTVLEIPCIGHSAGGFSGTDLDVFDENGWVDECTYCSVSIDCGPCPWDVQHVLVTISIPDGITGGTTDRLRLIPSGPCCLGDSTAFYIQAVSEVSVEESSWGKIKETYK
jgi:hypothetical protein